MSKEINISSFKKERHNPLELIKYFWPKAYVGHITYNPKLKEGDFNVIRQSGGDGTLLFTLEMFQKGLIAIANGTSFCTSTEPKDWSKVKGIRYIIGTMRHATVYGRIYLKCSNTHKYPGQIERIRMPVKVEYVYK